MTHIPQDLVNELNRQLTRERQNQATYAAMAAVLEARNYVHLARAMREQSKGEGDHAARIADYLGDRDDVAVYDTLPATMFDHEAAPQSLFALAVTIEANTTAAIAKLYLMAKAMDAATEVFLHWFISEQIEEEKLVGELVDQWARYPAPADGFVDSYIRENWERLFPS